MFPCLFFKKLKLKTTVGLVSLHWSCRLAFHFRNLIQLKAPYEKAMVFQQHQLTAWLPELQCRKTAQLGGSLALNYIYFHGSVIFLIYDPQLRHLCSFIPIHSKTPIDFREPCPSVVTG